MEKIVRRKSKGGRAKLVDYAEKNVPQELQELEHNLISYVTRNNLDETIVLKRLQKKFIFMK